jgi:uncharacterized protein involved in exopolysaccharide biosynthesis
MIGHTMTGPASPREHLAAFTAFVARMRRRIPIGAVALGLGLALTVAFTLSTHRLYRSEALLAYERGAQAVGMAEGLSPKVLFARVGDMVTSRTRLAELIKSMKLYPGIVDNRGMVEAIDEMRRHLKVSMREGYTLDVSYDGESRDLAKDVLDRLLASVIDEDNQQRGREATDALTLLEKERRQADDNLKTREAALSSFLASHPQLAGEVGSTATSGGLLRAAERDRAASVGTGDVAALELQAAQIEESLNAAGARPPASPTEAAADPALVLAETRAEGELQAARVDLADKQTRYTNEHPDVKMAMRRVSVAESALKRAQAAVVASRGVPRPAAAADPVGGGGEGRVAALQRALAAVRQQIASVRGRGAPRVEVPKATGSMVAIDTEWTRLNREVTEATERQAQLQSKQFQAELASMLTSAGAGARLVIADHPFRPLRPIAGGRFKVAMAGAAGSLFLALLSMAAFALFDDHLYGAPDVQRVLDDCIVVVIPSLPKKLPPRSEEPPRKGKEPPPPEPTKESVAKEPPAKESPAKESAKESPAKEPDKESPDKESDVESGLASG